MLSRARQPPAHSYLVRRRLNRIGALFAGDVAEGNGRRTRRLAHRNPCDRSFAGRAGEIQGGTIQPIRSPARPSDQMLVKYFKQTGEFWQINADIRAMVQHRQLNLLHDFSQLGVFDVILRDFKRSFTK
jgi:hypothetical protein